MINQKRIWKAYTINEKSDNFWISICLQQMATNFMLIWEGKLNFETYLWQEFQPFSQRLAQKRLIENKAEFSDSISFSRTFFRALLRLLREKICNVRAKRENLFIVFCHVNVENEHAKYITQKEKVDFRE